MQSYSTLKRLALTYMTIESIVLHADYAGRIMFVPGTDILWFPSMFSIIIVTAGAICHLWDCIKQKRKDKDE